MKCRACSALTLVWMTLLCASSLQGATLASLRATMTVGADGSCGVRAVIEVKSHEPEAVVHRLLIPRSAGAFTIDITGAGSGPASRVGSTMTLPVHIGAGLNSYEAHYLVPAIDGGRCPLLVPDAATDGVSRRVDLEVVMPADARRLPGGFPALAWSGNSGRVTLGHVPAFVLVPHANAGTHVSWWHALDVRRLVDGSAVAFLLLATLVWWSRRRMAP